MQQEKTQMSKSWMKWARKKQDKEFMKQVNKRNQEYMIHSSVVIEELRSAPSVHDINNLDS